MNGRFLLDTNVVVSALRGDPLLELLQADAQLYVPIIALGELYFGAHKSARVVENVEKVDAFASAHVVVECDLSTAQHYGQIQAALKAKGRPIPQNDTWIAAIAIQHGLTLITRDAHFANVDGLASQRL